MARNQDALAAQALGEELEQARADAGYPSFKELERLVYDELGAAAPGDEAIRKYHRGKVSPQGADLAVICILAGIYGRTVESLSAVLSERLAAEKKVLLRTPGCLTADDARAKALLLGASAAA